MTESKTQTKPGLGSRLGWFVCLYCVGAVTVALVAYGIRLWVGG